MSNVMKVTVSVENEDGDAIFYAERVAARAGDRGAQAQDLAHHAAVRVGESSCPPETDADTPAPSISSAELFAKRDADNVIAVADATDALAHSDGGRELIVDGSMYGPSLRAVGHAEDFWAMHDFERPEPNYFDAYMEEFDRLTGNYSGEDGRYLTWDEGMLFVQFPDEEDY